VTDIPDPASIGHLILSVPVIAVVLYFAWRMQREQRSVTDRQNELIDRWWTRHEDDEEHQRQTVEKLADNIHANTAALAELAASIRTQSPTFPTLAHEAHDMRTHTADSDHEYHIGLPPESRDPGSWEPEPGEILGRTRITGESTPWTHAEFGIDALYQAGVRGAGAVVVVIDTGIDPNHTDLKPNHDASKSKSFTGELLNDGNGHGTHCCGIVAADDNGSGVRGVAPDATVIAMKGLSNQGSGYGSWLSAAIRAAADLPGHKILSMSFGAGGEDPAISEAIRYAHSKGCWLFAAAGNEGPGSVNWPGALDEVVCVASTDKGGGVSSYSSANDAVDVGFGGRDILSTYPGNRLATLSGTSMATPGVAGVAALAVGELLKAGKPIPSQEAMKKVLYETCSDPAGRNIYTGYGLVQPAKFIRAMVSAGGPVNPPPVTPAPVKIAVPPGAKFLVFEM